MRLLDWILPSRVQDRVDSSFRKTGLNLPPMTRAQRRAYKAWANKQYRRIEKEERELRRRLEREERADD